MGRLRLAIGFLTRIPVGDDPDDRGPIDMSGAVPWFPVVGAGIGTAQGLAWVGLHELVSPVLAAALAVAVATLLTGAFHHDGLADMADAFGGGCTVEQRLEILKDPRLGTYGTSALTMSLLIEVAAIAAFDPWDGFRAIVAAHVLGRATALVAMNLAPPAGDGMGASYITGLVPSHVLAGAAVGPIVAVAVLGTTSLWAIFACVVAGAAVTRLAWRKIGGINGDVLGAIHVISALAVLVTVAATI